jgi:hypothetical protein
MDAAREQPHELDRVAAPSPITPLGRNSEEENAAGEVRDIDLAPQNPSLAATVNDSEGGAARERRQAIRDEDVNDIPDDLLLPRREG